MANHTHLHRAARLVAVAALFVTAACSGASPQIKVLGAEQGRGRAAARNLTVFVEVVNPTGRDLALSRLDYDFRAADVFAERGSVTLTRRIGANSSAVVEIPVPVDRASASRLAGAPYRLDGRLFAHADHLERSWRVAVKGELEASPVAGDHVLRVKLGASSSSTTSD